MDKIELGDLAKDTITNYIGVVTGFTKHITGCDRFILQSQECKDGKLPDAYSFDVTTVELVKKGVVKVPEDRLIHKQEMKPTARPGGPPTRESRR